MLEAQIFLVASVRVAGLHIDLHHCQELLCSDGYDAATRLSSIFPFEVQKGDGAEGSCRITGFPAEFTRRLLFKLRGSDTFGSTNVCTHACTCKVKTVVVPSHGLGRWSHALAISPFGSAAVAASAPYLGVTVAATALDHEVPTPGALSSGARQVIRDGTWGQCLLKIRARALAISNPTASPAVKAGNWNTYMVTTVPYPSQLATLDRDIAAELTKVFHALLPTRGWLNSSVLTAVGTVCEVRGAPKCFVAVSRSSALIAYLRQGGWGPSSLTPGVAERWQRIKDWAHSDPQPDPRWPWAPSLARHKKAIRKISGLDGRHSDTALGSVAGALYAATLVDLDKNKAMG